MKTEILRLIASKEDLSKYSLEAIDYLIGYGCGKCLSIEAIADLIVRAGTEVDVNDPEEVLDWIIERESD